MKRIQNLPANGPVGLLNVLVRNANRPQANFGELAPDEFAARSNLDPIEVFGDHGHFSHVSTGQASR